MPAIVQKIGRFPEMARFFTADGMRELCFAVSAAEARRHGRFVPLVPADECGNADVGLGNGHEHKLPGLRINRHGAVRPPVLNGQHNGERDTIRHATDPLFRDLVFNQLRDAGERSVEHCNGLAAAAAVDRP